MSEILKHPPIHEAILEVLFTCPPEVNISFIKNYEKAITSRFLNRNNIFEFTGNVEGNENKSKSSITTKTIGFQYKSADGNKTVQTRQNGFSYSILNRTYSDWNSYKAVAFEELQSYMEFVNPISIDRISLRFINQIEIPLEQNISEYFNLFPALGKLTKPISNFLMRLEVINEPIDAIGVITQLLSPTPSPQTIVYLDIDVIIFNKGQFQIIDLDVLMEHFDRLRDFKNEIFFNALTAKALETYN